jgi:ADP-ribose pyrophosphatase
VIERSETAWQAKVVATLTENPYFAVRQQLVTRPDGASLTYYTIDFPRPSVGIVARRGSDFLLIRQYRFIVGQWVWAIASGGVGANESAEAAARRELLEETGYAAVNLRPLLDYYPSYGSGNQQYQLFLAEDPVRTDADFDRDEVHDVRWFSRDEVIELVRRNGIVDGLSLTPLLLVLLDDAGREHGGPSYLP